MKVLTKPYGEMEIAERQRISFARGLFGFEDLREFVLLDATQQPFYWLQSVERVEVAFVLIDPLFFRPDYTPDVDPGSWRRSGSRSGEDMLVFAIVTIPENSSRMTANLQGPLILNRRTHVGRQSISSNPRWGVRHVILDELAAGQAGRFMLILARRIGESIMIGDQVEISVVDIKGDQVKLGIKAPVPGQGVSPGGLRGDPGGKPRRRFRRAADPAEPAGAHGQEPAIGKTGRSWRRFTRRSWRHSTGPSRRRSS